MEVASTRQVSCIRSILLMIRMAATCHVSLDTAGTLLPKVLSCSHNLHTRHHRFLLDGSFCLISHDFNRACSCFRASLEVSSSKTRKASRTRHTGSVLHSVSGSCSTQCQRSAKVSKCAGGQVVQRCHRQSLENQAVQHCWLIHT